MIQLEKFVGGGVVWLTPTTYIQLAGAGSIISIPPLQQFFITKVLFLSNW